MASKEAKLEDAVEAFLVAGGDRDEISKVTDRVYLRLSRANEHAIRSNVDIRAHNDGVSKSRDKVSEKAVPYPELAP
jgi:hypothetical protein